MTNQVANAMIISLGIGGVVLALNVLNQIAAVIK